MTEQPVPSRVEVDAVECGDLSDPGRLETLAASGLGPQADPEMERFAARVRRWVGVPVALVSLVRPDEQVFPGAVGLVEPWASGRRTPLTHSFCQHVALTGEPLVVEDAREEPLVRENLAIPQLGVVAYAGMPLRAASGHVLGSLCAIDTAPRRWSPTELEALADLAAACSTELRLRLARVDAERERARRDDLETELRGSFDRSQTLLQVSQSLADSNSLDDVRTGLDQLTTGGLEPDHVRLVTLDDHGVLRWQADPRTIGPADQDPWTTFGVDEQAASAQAMRERRLLCYGTQEEFDADYPPANRARLRELGLHSLVAAPLVGGRGVVGALILGWRQPRAFPPTDLLLIGTVAAYTARAIDHATWVQSRVTVVREMQQAMLTTLPDFPGLELAARYKPADSREDVGGDWFDVSPLVDPRRERDTAVALSVGDIIGHELHAAIRMGQVRSMLRQAAWDHPAGPPSLIMHSFETANAGVGLNAAGTAVLAHLRRDGDRDWSMSWINAGHPPPILVHPDGGAELLPDHGRLFGLPPGMVDSRDDQVMTMAPGSLLLLYTDGLVERRGTDIDERTDALMSMVAARCREEPAAIADAVMASLGAASDDDVVVLAIRFGPA